MLALNDATSTVIAAAIGAIVGVSVLLLQAMFDNRQRKRQVRDEHARWVRDQRLRAYLEFYAVAKRIEAKASGEDIPFGWLNDEDGWMKTADELSQECSVSAFLVCMFSGRSVTETVNRLRDLSNQRLLLTVPADENDPPPGTPESRSADLTAAHANFLLAAREELRVDLADSWTTR